METKTAPKKMEGVGIDYSLRQFALTYPFEGNQFVASFCEIPREGLKEFTGDYAVTLQHPQEGLLIVSLKKNDDNRWDIFGCWGFDKTLSLQKKNVQLDNEIIGWFNDSIPIQERQRNERNMG